MMSYEEAWALWASAVTVLVVCLLILGVMRWMDRGTK